MRQQLPITNWTSAALSSRSRFNPFNQDVKATKVASPEESSRIVTHENVPAMSFPTEIISLRVLSESSYNSVSYSFYTTVVNDGLHEPVARLY